jgi:hypothetical protein
MKFSFSPNVMIVFFVIAGRCLLSDATPGHYVPEQQEDRILQDKPRENDVEPCSSSCDSSAISALDASLDIQVEEQDDEVETGGIFGGLLGRLMNGFFKIFKRRQGDRPKYTVGTESIIQLLADSSSKFKTLAKMIMQESLTDGALSTTPDAVNMLYTAAADNMMLVTTVLDPIVDNMRLHATMDLRSISCDLMTVLTLLRDITVPNIKLMAKLLYINSDDAATTNTINQYIDTSNLDMLSTASTTTSSIEDSTCISAPLESATARLSAEKTSIRGLLNFLFDDTLDVGPVGNIVSIVLLILFFPVSIVISIAFTIFFISYRIYNQIFGDPVIGIFRALLLILIFALAIPFTVIYEILENLKELFTNNPDPSPTPSPKISPAPSATSVTPQALEVKRRIMGVLHSPIKTIVTLLGNENRITDVTKEDKHEMDCEMVGLSCKADALSNILPF